MCSLPQSQCLPTVRVSRAQCCVNVMAVALSFESRVVAEKLAHYDSQRELVTSTSLVSYYLSHSARTVHFGTVVTESSATIASELGSS